MKKARKPAGEQDEQTAKRGRPPVTPEKLRTAPILVRFTAQERVAVDAAAKEKSLKISAWLRNLALRAVGFKPKPPELPKE